MKKSFALILSAMTLAVMANATVRIDRLSVEGRTDQPLGLDVTAPRLGWQLVADAGEKNVVQTRYEIQVASSRDLLAEGKADLWQASADTD